LPKPYKLCIEIDGDVHDSFEQKIKDNKKDWYLKNLRKFNVLRLTNEKAELITIDELKKVLFSVLK
jgi:very-short-patch-repair endonuclease